MNLENTPSSDERLLAGFSHLLGPLVALIILIAKKDQPGYVRFQAAQSLAFSAVGFVVTLLLAGCMVATMLVSFSGLAAASIPSNGDPGAEIFFPMLVPFMAFFCITPLALAISAARLIAAVLTFQGKDFRYPWLANQVERFLSPVKDSLQ